MSKRNNPESINGSFLRLLVCFALMLQGLNGFSQDCSFTTNIPPNGMVTVNGVQITTSYTGSVELYTMLPSFTSCGLYTVNSDPLWVGQTGVWSITFDFNTPVNDLLFVINATGNVTDEDFIFNCNSGPVSVLSSSNCYSTISGNTIFSGAASDMYGGGGFFTANAAAPYTQLIVSGNGGNSGSLMAICEASIVVDPGCSLTNVTPNLTPSSACLTASTFDLSGIAAANTPAGAALNWFSSTPAGASGLIADPTAVGAGTYYAAFYDSANDCYSLTAPFNVNPEPVAAFSSMGACEGSPVDFTDESSVTSGSISTWDWDFGGGSTSAQQHPSHTFVSGINQTVTLTVTTAAGCSNTLTQTINLHPEPVADFQALAGCANTPVSFTDLSAISSGNITNWDWDFGDGNSSSLQNPTNQYASASVYNVTLTVTSDFGCSNVISQQVSTSALIADFTVTSGCLNAPTQFTDQSVLNGGTITNWSWDFGDGTTSNLQDPSHVYTSMGNFTVNLTVTSDAGCTNTVSQQVTVNADPVANFDAVGACSGTAVPFTDLSTINPGSISNWNWNFGDGSSSSVQNPSHVYMSGGMFNVTLEVTSNAGCTASVTQPVLIDQSPNASFSYNPTEPDILNTTVQFINQSTGSITYSWNFAGSGTSNQTNPIYTFPDIPGNYAVTLVASNGICTDTLHQVIVVNDALIYYVPNAFTPDGDEFNQEFVPVFTNGFDPYDFNMKIFNRWGELIFESNDAKVGWDGSYHGMYVPDGIYSWQIEFKTTMSDERVITNGHVVKLR